MVDYWRTNFNIN